MEGVRIVSLITLDEARAFAHDYETDDAEMTALIATAEAYIQGGVGKVDAADPRAKHLCKLLVCDLDENRSTTSAKESNARSAVVTSLMLQLRVSVSNLDTTGEATASG